MPEWPREELRQHLPDHVRLTLSARFVELTCERCGWLEVLGRDTTTPDQVLLIARAHRCPNRAER